MDEDDQARGRCFAVGLVDVRENGEREGAGFAGDVGDKGDGRAKFAQAAGKCQEASHEHARRGQAQRNGNKGAKRMGTEGARCAFKPGVDAFNRQAHGSQHEREPHHSSRQNSTAPRKRNLHPKPFAQNMTQKPSASQQQEKQIADHDGRQHEGQVAQAVEEELAAKVFARQHPPQRDGKGQADHHAEHTHLEREGEDGVFFGSWEYHKKWVGKKMTIFKCPQHFTKGSEIEARRIAQELLKNPPNIGYLTISNALQWRLQYRRLIEQAG